jgi:hypothetical protein
MVWLRLIELTVGMILLVAVLAKLRRPATFVEALADLEFLPESAKGVVAAVAIACEALVGVLLVADIGATIALATGFVLFVVFSAVSWSSLASRDSAATECGCLGGTLRLRHSFGSTLVNLGVAGLCLGAVVALVGWEQSQDLAVGEPVLAGLAASLCALYWLTQFAFSVLPEMLEDAFGEEGPG